MNRHTMCVDRGLEVFARFCETAAVLNAYAAVPKRNWYGIEYNIEYVSHIAPTASLDRINACDGQTFSNDLWLCALVLCKQCVYIAYLYAHLAFIQSTRL